jgi:hypothetical protein
MTNRSEEPAIGLGSFSRYPPNSRHRLVPREQSLPLCDYRSVSNSMVRPRGPLLEALEFVAFAPSRKRR